MKKVILILNLAICYLTSYSQEFGTYTDPRDGKVYKTVKIGTQWVMAENLAFKPDSRNYWAYNNDNNNVAKYGYLYDWKTAKSVVPAGWHLPTREEWMTLYEYLGGQNNKVFNGMKEGGSSGFNALFGGWYHPKGKFYTIGERAYFWSSTGQNNSDAWIMYFKTSNGQALPGKGFIGSGFSVRLFANNADILDYNSINVANPQIAIGIDTTYLSKKADNLTVNSRGEGIPAFRNIKSVKIIVSQYSTTMTHYKYDAILISLPFKEITARLLEYAGIKEDTVNYDMIIRIVAYAGPQGAMYSGEINGYNYTGVNVAGSLIFEAPNKKLFKQNFRGGIAPPQSIKKAFKSPCDAPFMEGFYSAFLPILMKSTYISFGITPLIIALKDDNEGVRREAAYALGNIKDIRAVEPLIGALKDYDFGVLEAATHALGNIKDTRAIEPLLGLMMNNRFNELVRALKKITGKNFGNSYTEWQEWWILKNY